MPKPTIEDLLSTARETTSRPRKCWFDRLPAEDREYLDGLAEAYWRDPDRATVTALYQAVAAHFSIRVGRQQFERWLKDRRPTTS